MTRNTYIFIIVGTVFSLFLIWLVNYRNRKTKENYGRESDVIESEQEIEENKDALIGKFGEIRVRKS